MTIKLIIIFSSIASRIDGVVLGVYCLRLRHAKPVPIPAMIIVPDNTHIGENKG